MILKVNGRRTINFNLVGFIRVQIHQIYNVCLLDFKVCWTFFSIANESQQKLRLFNNYINHFQILLELSWCITLKFEIHDYVYTSKNKFCSLCCQIKVLSISLSLQTNCYESIKCWESIEIHEVKEICFKPLTQQTI